MRYQKPEIRSQKPEVGGQCPVLAIIAVEVAQSLSFWFLGFWFLASARAKPERLAAPKEREWREQTRDAGRQAAASFFSGQPLGAPQRRYVQAPSPRLPPLPRAAYELPAEMDPGFPTRAGGRRAPEVVRYTGRETRGHSFSDEAAGPFRSSPQAPQPCPLMPGRS